MKLNLIDTRKQELKLFFWLTRQNNSIEVALGYDIEDSLKTLNQRLPAGIPLSYKGFMTVSGLLSQVKDDKKEVKKEARKGARKEVKMENTKKMNKEQFKNSLLLVLNDFIKRDGEKKALTKIIKKL